MWYQYRRNRLVLLVRLVSFHIELIWFESFFVANRPSIKIDFFQLCSWCHQSRGIARGELTQWTNFLTFSLPNFYHLWFPSGHILGTSSTEFPRSSSGCSNNFKKFKYIGCILFISKVPKLDTKIAVPLSCDVRKEARKKGTARKAFKLMQMMIPTWR